MKKEMVFLGIIVMVICIGGFYIYQYIISPKLVLDPNKGFEEIEAKYPARESELDTLAFGSLFINGNSDEPTRSLHMKQKVDTLKQHDLEKAWAIVDDHSAKQVLKSLGELENTESFPLNQWFTKEFADLWKRNEQGKMDKKEVSAAAATINEFPESLSAVIYKLAGPDMKLPYSEIFSITKITAWDIERLAGVARKCYHAGFITEDECYSYLNRAKSLALMDFNSWEEYFISFMVGRGVLYSSDNMGQWIYSGKGLLETPNSIWNETAVIWV